MSVTIPYHFYIQMQSYVTSRGGDWEAIPVAEIERIYRGADETAGLVGMYKTLDGPHPAQQQVVAALDTIIQAQIGGE